MIYTSPTRANQLVSQRVENNPFVAWNNLGAAATLGGTSTIAGGQAANAVTGSTYDRWRPITGGTTRVLSFDLGAPAEASFAALVAHNLGTLGGSVSVDRSSDGTTWVDVGTGTVAPGDNAALAFRFEPQTWRYWRFAFSGLATDAALSVGVAFIGRDLIIPQMFYQGFAPIITPTEVELQSNVSVGNELLGSSVIGRGSTLSFDVTYLPDTFVRGEEWVGFQRHFNEGGGSIFGWRPAKYPQDVHYMWRDGPVIRAGNSGPRSRMDIAISARVYNAQP